MFPDVLKKKKKKRERETEEQETEQPWITHNSATLFQQSTSGF